MGQHFGLRWTSTTNRTNGSSMTVKPTDSTATITFSTSFTASRISSPSIWDRVRWQRNPSDAIGSVAASSYVGGRASTKATLPELALTWTPRRADRRVWPVLFWSLWFGAAAHADPIPLSLIHI